MRSLLLLFISIFITSCTVTPVGNSRDVYYVQNNGATLPVFISGTDSQEIVLYVHGGPGSSALLYSYAPIWEILQKKYRMVFYDQRGSGGGRGHIDQKDMTVEQHVSDLTAIIASVKAKYPSSKIYLFGHSYGGMISTSYTTLNQDKISGLMLLAPAMNIVDLSTRIPATMLTEFIIPYLNRTDISAKSRTYWEEAKVFYQNNSPLLLDSFIQHNVYVNIADPILGFEKFNQYYDSVLPKLLADPLLEPLIWSTQVGLMLPALDSNQESSRNLETDPIFNVSKITIPTMLVVGKQDLIVPPQSSINAFNKISSTVKTLHEYENASHNPFLEYPEKLEKDISDFIVANP